MTDAQLPLAKQADLVLIAPATANVIAKMAHGIADDMLTTVVLAARCKKLVAPAMNTAMLENPITQDNIKLLKQYGFEIIEPVSGLLACNDVGSGKLPEPEVLCDYVARELAREKDLAGVHVTVTAGPTQEALDPVRFLTNHSTGKMGYAIAREAMLRGAEVTMISGEVALSPVPFVKMVYVKSAKEMFEAVKQELPKTNILIKSAAVADYRIRSNRKLGLLFDVDEPEKVGVDRICDAVFAAAAYTLPVITVDLGTATTFNVIDRRGCFLAVLSCRGLKPDFTR